MTNYIFWASNGGVEAMMKEHAKCQPLCKLHHDMKTKAQRKTGDENFMTKLKKELDKTRTPAQIKKSDYKSASQKKCKQRDKDYVDAWKINEKYCWNYEVCRQQINPDNPGSMHIHHVGPKKHNIADMVEVGRPIAAIDQELKDGRCRLSCKPCNDLENSEELYSQTLRLKS